MVKVLRPKGVFSRCVDTAIVGITLAETDADAVGNYDGNNDNHDPQHQQQQWYEPKAPPPPPPSPARFVDNALWLLKNHLLHRIELVEMAILHHKMALRMASSRNETMRLYDQALSAAVSQRCPLP